MTYLLSELVAEVPGIALVVPGSLVAGATIDFMHLRNFIPLHLLLDLEHDAVFIL